jgi:hypothetical protein
MRVKSQFGFFCVSTQLIKRYYCIKIIKTVIAVNSLFSALSIKFISGSNSFMCQILLKFLEYTSKIYKRTVRNNSAVHCNMKFSVGLIFALYSTAFIQFSKTVDSRTLSKSLSTGKIYCLMFISAIMYICKNINLSNTFLDILTFQVFSLL